MEMWKFSYQKNSERISYQKWEKANIGRLSLIVRTVTIDFKMCCLYVVLVLPGNVLTQLGWSGKFC